MEPSQLPGVAATARDEPGVILPDDEALAEAMRIHRITWL
jgi:hypothetical protein